MKSSNLCSPAELKSKLGHQDLIVIDASWYMPAAGIDSHARFLDKRISGAVFFDIDKVCDPKSALPHMLPSEVQMGAALIDLGISHDSDLVVYDTSGLFSAARVWWMLKLFGHESVSILDGGLPAWCEAGGQLDSQSPTPIRPTNISYNAKINETFLVDKDVLIENSKSEKFLVLDARSRGRFTGVDPEPRVGLPSGHMPYSKSLPFDQLIEDGRLKSPAALRKIFADYGLDPEHDTQAIVSSCGSGVTAAIITLALSEAGFSMHRLYDGAWAEWASSSDTIVLQGE